MDIERRRRDHDRSSEKQPEGPAGVGRAPALPGAGAPGGDGIFSQEPAGQRSGQLSPGTVPALCRTRPVFVGGSPLVPRPG